MSNNSESKSGCGSEQGWQTVSHRKIKNTQISSNLNPNQISNSNSNTRSNDGQDWVDVKISKPTQLPKYIQKSRPASGVKVNVDGEITQIKKVSPQMTKTVMDARVGKKLTQIQLANISGVDAKIINEIERGGCIYNADVFNKISKALGIKIERNCILENKK